MTDSASEIGVPHGTGGPQSRTLVTGATGFIGRHLARRLSAGGSEVHATTRAEPDPGFDDEVHWHTGDLREGDFVRAMVDRVQPDAIYHLASLVTGSRSLDEVLPTLENNLLTSVNLLDSAARVGDVHFVHVGSVEEADCTSSAARARSPYAAAKRAASDYAMMFCDLYDLSVVHVRPAMVYGPGQRDASKLVPYVTTSLLKGEQPQIHDGGRRADWVYVDDVVTGLVAAGRKPGASGHAIDLGTGLITSVRDVVEEIHRLVDRPSVRPDFGDRSERPLEYEEPADTTAAENLLGWKAEVSLREGLETTVRWYEAHLERARP